MQPPEPIGAKLAADEIDLSTGELQIPEAAAAAVKEGGDLDVKVRLPGLAEGTLHVRKRGAAFGTVGVEQAILLRHPALKLFAASTPMVLALNVKDNKVAGWVGLGAPGPAKGGKAALGPALVRGTDLLGWAGLSKLSLPAFRNQFVDGAIDVGVDNLAFTVGGFLSGSGSAALDNQALSFEGAAKIEIPGGSGGELLIKKDPTGALSGKLDMIVAIGSVTGTVTATMSRGFVSVTGSVAYASDRLNGKITLVATDEVTAREITRKKPDDGGDIPIELPGPDKPAKPGRRAYCGWGNLTFRVNDWLAGTATVVVNSKGQATVIGEIAPPKEFRLFEKKPWRRNIFKLEIRAGYGIPVVGQVGLFANIGIDAVAELGPGILKDLKLAGVYSTDPGVPKALSIEGTINISAFAGLELVAQAGLVVTILGHDIKAGVELKAMAGVRGYVQATPRIGMREPVPGKREYYIQGHMEIAAEPVLGFSGDLFVSIDTPWWSPLSDKTWTWPLFSIEYPLPGEFGLGADVDYVLGSKKWPEIAFGEVDFDGSKFLSDVMNDNTDKGHGGETKKPGDWEEGPAKGGPGGAKNKGGSGKKPGEVDDDLGPIGERESFSDGGETHEIWFEQKGPTAELMMASGSPARIEKKLDAYEKSIDLLLDEQRKTARTLLDSVRKQNSDLREKAEQLAAMKVAARHAKEVYEKNKGKARKKAGQKKGKDGGKELAKQVKAGEKALRPQLKALAELLRTIPFKPIKRQPGMAHGGKESVELVDKKTHVGLKIADKPDKKELAAIVAGVPFTQKAVSPTGHDLVKAAVVKTDTLVETLAKVPTKGGDVNAKVWKTLDKPADQAAGMVAGIGSRLDIATLERARKFVRIETNKLREVNFTPTPKSPIKGGKIYVAEFVKEMKRQIKDQERGINLLSVDQWTNNLAKFSVDPRVFRALDVKGRQAVFDELTGRGQKATTRVAGTIKRVSKQIDALDEKAHLTPKEKQKLDKLIRTLGRSLTRASAVVTAQDEITVSRQEERAPDADLLKPEFGPKDEMGLRIRSRQGAERKARDSVPQQALEDLIDQMRKSGEWEGLAIETRHLAILHRPDQVAGGYDHWNDLPEAPDRDDTEKWGKYLEDLKKFFGPGVVNSNIGRQWTQRLIYSQALSDVRRAVPFKASYPLHRLNLILNVISPG
ncbi:MAG TPA: polymorphic toxin type 15 domain-containing protein [Polyangia bacterium]